MNSKDNKQKKKKRHKKKCTFVYDFIKVTGALFVMCWLKPKVIYAGKFKRKDYKGGFLMSCNHIGFTDPIMAHCVFWHRRINCLATKDLYDTPFKRWFFNQLLCIEVDKENFSMDSFHEVITRLKDNKIVLIFPEGQVNHNTEDVLTFKSGATLMAHRANKPIVPVYFPEYDKKMKRVAIVGDPIDVRAMCDGIPTMEKLNEVSAYIRQKELELKELYETQYKNNPKRKK